MSLPYNISIILKLKGHIKGKLISRIVNFKKNPSSGLKIIRYYEVKLHVESASFSTDNGQTTIKALE